jgi:hypothetical protein
MPISQMTLIVNTALTDNTPYYTALLPDIQVHCSIGSLGISALTVGMRNTDWLKVSLSGNDVCAYEAVHLFHF